MKKRNKWLTLTAGVLMAASLLTACGQQAAQNPAQQEQTAQGDIDITADGMTGKWYLEGKTAAAYLSFADDGTVESYEAGGEKLASGQYTVDGSNVTIRLSKEGDTDSTEKNEGDLLVLTDENTLYFEEQDKTYIRGSVVEAEQEKQKEEQKAANAAEAEAEKNSGADYAELSDADIDINDISDTSWYYMDDKSKGNITFNPDGTMENEDADGNTVFTGIYKVNGSVIEVYTAKGDYQFDIRMQKDGNITDDNGKSFYAKSRK